MYEARRLSIAKFKMCAYLKISRNMTHRKEYKKIIINKKLARIMHRDKRNFHRVSFSLQKHVIQQISVFHGLPWQIQSVERTQGHSSVLLRWLAISLLHRQKFGQLRIQGASSEIGGRSGEQASRALQGLAFNRGRTVEEAMRRC